jgi:chromosomal replication initiator protein DnaA
VPDAWLLAWNEVQDPMSLQVIKSDHGALPDFLRVSVEKGLVDETTARRIELYRKTRTLRKDHETFEIVHTRPDPEMTFGNYVRCKGNAFALELARIVAGDQPRTEPYNPIYIYSDVGNGKTHLLSAIANEAAHKCALLVNTVDLAADFELARQISASSALRQWLSSMEILLIDDIQLCEGDEQLQADLFTILNHMITAGKWVVISSDAYPTRLVGLESRLMSRLRGGVIVGLQMPDEGERLEILRHFTREQPIADDVLDYVATNVSESIRQLKATIAQVRLTALQQRSRITLEIARNAIQESETESKLQVPISQIPQTEVSLKADDGGNSPDSADRFKKMLAAAETEEEQILALQIALGERIRQLRNSGREETTLAMLENALSLLRDGHMDAAVKCLSA